MNLSRTRKTPHSNLSSESIPGPYSCEVAAPYTPPPQSTYNYMQCMSFTELNDTVQVLITLTQACHAHQEYCDLYLFIQTYIY